MGALQRKYRRRGPAERFSVPINQPRERPGPEVLPWYWHPNRDGVTPAPVAFAKQLAAIDPDLRACFSPVHERWMIWVKNPRIQHALCRGWGLLFLWEHPVTKAHLPLSELVFHNLMLIDANRFRNGLEYFDKIQKRIEAAKAEKMKTHTNERQSLQREIRDSWQISSAGKGNKFALHHDGTAELGRGDRNWREDTRKHRLPSALLRQEQDDKERSEYGS